MPDTTATALQNRTQCQFETSVSDVISEPA